MRAINLVFGTSNCIATGTPDATIEGLYQRAFKPFLQTLYEFPDISLTSHYSGALLEWLHERHPEFIMLLNEMVKRDQIELLGGTYYQTILPLIPANDRTAQVELLTTLLRRRFGKRPRGAWVTELVWEPGMASSLKRSGMEYTFLAENHFTEAGFSKDNLFKPVITEDQGKTLLVFPISRELGLFPFTTDPKKLIKRITGIASGSADRVITLIADGECYGEWSDSHKVLFEDGWLGEFLTAICELKGTITSTHPGIYVQREEEYSRCYFPCTSYEEMSTWSLSPERGREFGKVKYERLSKRNRVYLKGGYFRQFLSKYPESNLMYAKLIHTYDLVNQIRGDKYRKKAAREELWRGEDHSAYWHGKRGGIYLHPVRKAVYSALIAAEKTARQRGIFKSHISGLDFDLDGLTEYLFSGAELNVYVHRKGGMVFELDYIAKPWNYLDTLTRREEHYHDKFNGSVTLDGYPRRAFLDHFFAPNAAHEKNGNWAELGNFLTLPYEVSELKRDGLELHLSADGTVASADGERNVTIEKRYTMKRRALFVEYILTNNGPGTLEACFAPEINLSFPEVNDLSLSVQAGKAEEAVTGNVYRGKGAKSFTADDRKNGVTIKARLRRQCDLVVRPVEAEWLDRSGRHRSYQSTCFLPLWKLKLGEDEKWTTLIQVSFSRLTASSG